MLFHHNFWDRICQWSQASKLPLRSLLTSRPKMTHGRYNIWFHRVLWCTVTFLPTVISTALETRSDSSNGHVLFQTGSTQVGTYSCLHWSWTFDPWRGRVAQNWNVCIGELETGRWGSCSRSSLATRWPVGINETLSKTQMLTALQCT